VASTDGAPDVTVLIRAKDEAADIGHTLDSVAGQTVKPEIVVVDSGSTDGTPDIVRSHGARLIEIPAESFTYGRALNIGFEAATAPVVVPLSAHAFPRTNHWLADMLRHFEDPEVSCACGDHLDEHGSPLTRVVRWTAADHARNPYWGYSNHAGAVRRSLWAQRGFREEMVWTEDKEWSGWALSQGTVCIVNPALVVEHDHSDDSVRTQYRRSKLQQIGFAAFVDLPPYSARDAAREWWSGPDGAGVRWRARVNPRRVATVAGKYAGRTAAR
jgi:rhamnosyltransferase